jgi:GntR family transcriptional regulator
VSKQQPRIGAQGIADELRAQIESGAIAPGATLPSTRELVERYGVTKETVRQAILLLKAVGAVDSRQGARVRAAERRPLKRVGTARYAKSNWSQGIPAFAVDRVESGRAWAYTDQTNQVDPVHEADTEIADALGVEVGARVVARQRTVRDGQIITHRLTSYYRPEDVEGSPIMDDTPGTAGGAGGGFAILAELGMEPTEGIEALDVVLPTPDEQQALEIRATEPVVHVRRIVYDQTGRVIEFARGPYIGKYFRWINPFRIAS